MNVSLFSLWLPIVLGTVLAWIGSAVIHMVLKYHNSDYQRLANEDAVMDAVRAGNPSKGLHNFPHVVDMKEMGDKAVQARFEKGPVGFVLVGDSGMPPMVKLMGQQIAFYLVGCILIAWCASVALAPGAGYFEVFRFVLAVGFLAFGWATVPFSIWYGFPWSVTAKYLLDALIYAALIAGAFAGFWPSAA